MLSFAVNVVRLRRQFFDSSRFLKSWVLSFGISVVFFHFLFLSQSSSNSKQSQRENNESPGQPSKFEKGVWRKKKEERRSPFARLFRSIVNRWINVLWRWFARLPIGEDSLDCQSANQRLVMLIRSIANRCSLSHNQLCHGVMSYLFCTDITLSLWHSTLMQSQLHIFYEMKEVVGEWKCFVVEVLVPVDRAVWIQSETDLVSS